MVFMKMSIIQVFYKIFEYFFNNVFPLVSAGPQKCDLNLTITKLKCTWNKSAKLWTVKVTSSSEPFNPIFHNRTYLVLFEIGKWKTCEILCE